MNFINLKDHYVNFRITEIKNLHSTYFKPQYQEFILWHSISNSKFADTIFRHTEFNMLGTCTNTMIDAKKIIEEFKNWHKTTKIYTKIHYIK